MIAFRRRARASRLPALLVVFALSGAPAFVEALCGEREHRCHCHHGPGEQCTCPACRRIGAKARRAALEKLPPCHRAEAERSESAPLGADVVTGCCASAEHGRLLSTVRPFLLPTMPGVGPHAIGVRLPSGETGPREIVRAPPRPPPRAA